MKHASLFTGIGGFDLAAQWASIENIFQVEIDEFCQKVLTKNFPNVKKYRDIKEFDGAKYRGIIDIISGGFPCQPFSVSGTRGGKEDNRYLWHEMLRVIKETKPPWVIGENVTGILSMVDIFEEICTDLENIGYEVQPYIIPAGAIGSIHRRDRVWILAYSEHIRHERGMCKNIKGKNVLPEILFTRYETGSLHEIEEKFISKPGVCTKYDGLPRRVVKRELIAYGNAIVPQIALEFFKAIIKAQLICKSK